MNNITLIGMPGCGKSTIGVLLAKTLGMDFLDTDLLIQKQENCLLQQILNQRGLEYFLKAEEKAVLSAICSNTVIATGGSVVYSPSAMAFLKKCSTIIYLQLPFDEIMARLSNITTRGIAIPAGETMADVYKERTVLYQQYADLILNCTGQTPEQTISAILRLQADRKERLE